MTLQRAMIDVLDRPGGRRLLSALASWYIRRRTGQDAGVFYDGSWVRRIGGDYLADPPRFGYYGNFIEDWAGQVAQNAANTEDFWFHLYRPREGDIIVDVARAAGRMRRSFRGPWAQAARFWRSRPTR